MGSLRLITMLKATSRCGFRLTGEKPAGNRAPRQCHGLDNARALGSPDHVPFLR